MSLFRRSQRIPLRTWLIVVGILSFIVVWSWVLNVVGTERLVDYIGAENGYLVMFLVSLFGGVSSIGAVAYVTTIITLSGGGLDPFLLALASGAGVSIGDTIYYYLGRHGQKLLHRSRFAASITRFATWLDKRHPLVRGLGIYVYTAFTPLPNDILTIAMGVTRQPYPIVITALVLGNITHTFILATFGSILPW